MTDGVCMTRSRRPPHTSPDMTGSCFRVLALYSQVSARELLVLEVKTTHIPLPTDKSVLPLSPPLSIFVCMHVSLEGILSPASALPEPATTTADGYCPAGQCLLTGTPGAQQTEVTP